MQPEEDEKPVPIPYEPAGQAPPQEDKPGAEAYTPAGHLVQTAAPCSLLKLPGEHRTQAAAAERPTPVA